MSCLPFFVHLFDICCQVLSCSRCVSSWLLSFLFVGGGGTCVFYLDVDCVCVFAEGLEVLLLLLTFFRTFTFHVL
jgi:hypothetical protein